MLLLLSGLIKVSSPTYRYLHCLESVLALSVSTASVSVVVASGIWWNSQDCNPLFLQGAILDSLDGAIGETGLSHLWQDVYGVSFAYMSGIAMSYKAIVTRLLANLDTALPAALM